MTSATAMADVAAIKKGWRAWLWLAQAALLVGLAYLVDAGVGWGAVFDAMLATPAAAWAAGALGLFASYLLRAWRLQVLLQNEGVTFHDALGLIARHNLVCVAAPMRAGDVAFPFMLRATVGLSYRQGIGTVLAVRGLDIYAISGCLVLVLARSFGEALWPAIVIWVTVPLLISMPMFDTAMGRFPSFSGVRKELTSSPRLFVLSWAIWNIKLAGFAMFIFLAVDTGLVAALSGAIGGELAGALPFQGPAGLGTFEAGVVAAMASMQVDVSDAVGAALSLHTLILLFAIVAPQCTAVRALSVRS